MEPEQAWIETLGARLLTRGEKGMLLWSPTRDQVGTHFVTFVGTTETGLATRTTIRIDVEPRPWGGKLAKWRRAQIRGSSGSRA